MDTTLENGESSPTYYNENNSIQNTAYNTYVTYSYTAVGRRLSVDGCRYRAVGCRTVGTGL